MFITYDSFLAKMVNNTFSYSLNRWIVAQRIWVAERGIGAKDYKANNTFRKIERRSDQKPEDHSHRISFLRLQPIPGIIYILGNI